MFTLSPEGFRSSSDPSLDRYQLFLSLPLTSVNSVPSALKSTLNNTTPFAPARHSPLVRPTCPIYLGEIRREDSRRASIPLRIRTYEKSSRNSFRIRTSKTQDLKSFRVRTYKKTRGGGGLIVNQKSDHASLFCLPQAQPKEWDSQSWLFSSRHPELRSTGRHEAPVTSSLSASGYPFPLFTSQLSTVGCRPLPSHQSRITSHRFRNFYPPASDLRHNPAAQGQRQQSSSQTGRIR